MEEDAFFRKFILNIFLKEGEKLYICSPKTVSYTHLDVYKRQPVSSIQGYLETIVNNPTLPREKINAFLERSYAPVSYTHLDVYKRQMQNT